MNTACKKAWSMNFVRKVMTKAFVNGPYKQWRQQQMYDREKALLPASQEFAKLVLERESMDSEIKAVRVQLNAVKLEMHVLLNTKWDQLKRENPGVPASVLEGRARHLVQQQMDELVLQRIVLDHRDRVLQRNRHQIGAPLDWEEPAAVEKARFIRRCGDEACKGFLSTQWKCGLCSKRTCSQCHVLKGDDHECKADDVETAKLLSADTTPCPSCATPIYKISGCDQMWCTQCNTAFSWTTRLVERGPIHNPHYFEYMRTRAAPQRNPNDVICGRELNNDTIHLWSRGIYGHSPALTCVLDAAQSILHLRHDTLPRYRTDQVRDNEDLRVKFLLDRHTEDQFKAQLYKRQKEADKKSEMYDILFMFVQTATEILFRITEDDHAALSRGQELMQELNELATYASRCMHDVSSTFGCIRYEILPFKKGRGFRMEKYSPPNVDV
jgi:hypothetical protein